MEKTFNNIAILPFNLESFKNGAKAVNKFGKSVKFVYETADKILVNVPVGNFGRRETVKFNKNGRKYTNSETWEDLYMVA
ncbi:MAG: hypothetical protein J1F35_03725 [Erysipelotrichales bacterium]|nr:hypothetical protein [Erysipelotrichales bacterium]